MEVVAGDSYFPSIKEIGQMSLTFSFTVIAWIFFRADNIGHAINYLGEIFSSSLFTLPEIIPKTILLLIFIFIIIEWFGREGQYAIAQLGMKWKKPLRWTFYYAIILAIFYFGGEEQQFIYFQF